MKQRKITKKKPVKQTKSEDVVKYGKGLQHRETVNFNVHSVNNGYLLNMGPNDYVFSEMEDAIEFMKGEMPLKGTDQNFLDNLDDEKPNRRKILKMDGSVLDCEDGEHDEDDFIHEDLF